MKYSSEFIDSNTGYAGVKFIMHSPTLEAILRKYNISMPSETEDGNIVGDECWYFVCDEQKFTAPLNLKEVRRWILAFFECFGHYPLERPIYEDEEYQVDPETSKKLVEDIEKHIEQIMSETEEFKICCMAVDTDFEGKTFHYLDGIVHIDDIYPEDVVEFFEFYGLDGSEDFEDAGW